MLPTQSEIDEKQIEAETLLRLADDLSKKPGEIITVSIIKSAHILILYNTIESTTRAMLEEVHDAASRENYIDLNNSLREIWADYYFSKHAQSRRFGHLEGTLNGKTKFPKYAEYVRHINPFSGNLDSRQISKIMKRYEIGQVTSAGKERLVEIKNKRNRIAHGDEMFKEACRNYTLREMLALQDACFGAIKSMVSQAEDYLSGKKFLLRELRASAS